MLQEVNIDIVAEEWQAIHEGKAQDGNDHMYLSSEDSGDDADVRDEGKNENRHNGRLARS